MAKTPTTRKAASKSKEVKGLEAQVRKLTEENGGLKLEVEKVAHELASAQNQRADSLR